MVYFLTILFTLFLLAIFSTSTFLRNRAWENDITLWTDAVRKAPNNARALNILAIKLAWGNNSLHPKRYDMALKLLKSSLNKHMPSFRVKADIFGNMALIYFYNKNNHNKAIELFNKALKVNPNNLKIRRDLTNALIIMKNFKEADKHVDILITKNKSSGTYQNLKGHILLWQGRYVDSIEYFKRAHKLLPNKESVLLNTSVVLSLLGHYDNANKLLEETIKYFPNSLTYYFALIENSVRAGKSEDTSIYVKKIFQQFDSTEIRHGLETFTDNPKYAPISKKLIAPVINSML